MAKCMEVGPAPGAATLARIMTRTHRAATARSTSKANSAVSEHKPRGGPRETASLRMQASFSDSFGRETGIRLGQFDFDRGRLCAGQCRSAPHARVIGTLIVHSRRLASSTGKLGRNMLAWSLPHRAADLNRRDYMVSTLAPYSVHEPHHCAPHFSSPPLYAHSTRYGGISS